ncbi:MAG: acyltransferase [Verrucomicrobiales bacterium]|nr:acyltransferase [Verrucomicrobiales bacterium]
MSDRIQQFRSHGSGAFRTEDFGRLGRNVIFEAGVLVFHPENIELGSNIYVGHNTMLKGYHRNRLVIGDNSWIGQGCFFHAGGGISIGQRVGVGPFVKIMSTRHVEAGPDVPILFAPTEALPVCIEDDCNIGMGAIIRPGVTIGRGSQIGAGAVVTRSVPAYSVAAGVPAKVLRSRL